MTTPQPGILAPVPAHARYLTFELVPGAEADDVRTRLAALELDEGLVIGLSLPVVALLGGGVPALRTPPHLVGPGIEMPSTGGALWVWLRGEDRGVLVHATRSLADTLAGAFELVDATDGFRYGAGLDLTGYEDGTENPTDERAVEVALVSGAGPGLDGSSLVAVQKWIHDLSTFEAMSAERRDHTFGRRISDNEELEDAPESAHVKRTAQEDFEPEAFVVRRSMPWADAGEEGLVFVAFAASFDPFEALCRRMLGLDDGVVDALFDFTRPVTGSYYWCPPLVGRRLDLGALSAS